MSFAARCFMRSTSQILGDSVIFQKGIEAIMCRHYFNA